MTEKNQTQVVENVPSRKQTDVRIYTTAPISSGGLVGYLKKVLFGVKPDPTLRETLEEFIEDNASDELEPSLSKHERILIANVLELRDMTAADIMVPRVDIVAVNHDVTQAELFELLSTRQYSRLPVYKDTLDNIIGTIHVKDIMATMARGDKVDILGMVREIPIVSPSMQILDLLTQMRITKKHMVLVVDEFGGIDGLVTIGDMIESIVGEIDDEHDPDDQPEITIQEDGTVVADARLDLDEFEEKFGISLTQEEHDDNVTLGGLVVSIAGRVPARGEVLTHRSGAIFEVLEADPRRVKRLCIRNVTIR